MDYKPVEKTDLDISESITGSTKKQRIANLAKSALGMAIDLSHALDMSWMREAVRLTLMDGSAAVDGEIWKKFSEGLEARLESLLDHAESGTCRAPPVRRV